MSPNLLYNWESQIIVTRYLFCAPSKNMADSFASVVDAFTNIYVHFCESICSLFSAKGDCVLTRLVLQQIYPTIDHLQTPLHVRKSVTVIPKRINHISCKLQTLLFDRTCLKRSMRSHTITYTKLCTCCCIIPRTKSSHDMSSKTLASLG